MDGFFERLVLEFRHQRQGNRDEAFHIRSTAAIQQAVPFENTKGVAVPLLARHRHHIRVAGQDDTALFVRADRRYQVGLCPLIVLDPDRRNAEAIQVIGDKIDEAQV